MSFQIPLQFVCDLLSEMHISHHIAKEPSIYISPEIDLGLRAMLFGMENYAAFLSNSMSSARPNTIYRFFDEYFCNYIFMRLPDTKEESYFYLGPYLLSLPPEEQIRRKSASLKLTCSQYEQFQKYYRSLPVIEDENLLFSITNTLGKTLWGSSEHFTMEYLDYMIPDRSSPICVSPSYENSEEPQFSLSVIEDNYANEKILMDAVSQGKLHKINVLTSAVYNNGTEQRLSDSLRNRKNYLIILNTILRKAAEQGGVHPLHIDKISSSFARKIEAVYSIENSLTLQRNMIRNYCLLVKNHSISKYSYLVGRVITLISYDLTADLSLKNLASLLNVNATYLSGLFHKECGCTLTEYVHNCRMEHAVNLLNKTNKPINVIAFECGITDTNYFIKLFKKFTGMTPTQYRNTLYD